MLGLKRRCDKIAVVRSIVCWIATGICACAAAYSQAAPSPAEAVASFGTTVVVPGGLLGLIYPVHRNAKSLPDFRGMESVGTIYTSTLNVPLRDFREGFPGVPDLFEWFAIDYSGRFWIEKPGLYSFELTSDDGSKLYVDGRLVVDNDGVHAAETRIAVFTLEGGLHRIRVSYFQGPRFQVALVLRVARPGEEWRVFSTDEFKPPPDPSTWVFPEIKTP